MIFNKHSRIGVYTVTFPIKESTYAETYRVKDDEGKNYFLKLFNYAKLHRTQFDADGNVLELVIAKQLNHTNITHYHDSGELLQNGQKMAYIVFDFISGETVAQRVMREQSCSVFDAKQIVLGVLNGVKYSHSLPNPIIHNELTIQNVMLDLSAGTPVPEIIDFGYARFLNQGQKAFQKDGLNPFYTASEAFNGIFTPQSDLFSVGAMLYHLLFGLPPYFIDLSKHQADRTSLEDAVLAERQKPLRILNKEIFELDEQLLNIIAKALATDVDVRFKTADEFIKALNGDLVVDGFISTNAAHRVSTKQITEKSKKKGNGFADVAGMESLKEQLRNDVIDLLEHPEENKALGIPMPNGLLFYGPPGCGKTYFADKFAEEIGCNYMYIKCSDVASPYIHGGQEKIAKVFEEARKNAPTILFFDEIEAMITDRRRQSNVSESGEVNEFLAQLNNCGENGVLVIGATNNPRQIDTAALRAGRLEQKIYVPNPDFETRKSLLKLYLDYRADFGIDYDKLAKETENFVSSDIKFLTDTAARKARREHLSKITMNILEQILSDFKPTVSLDEIKQHEAVRDKFLGTRPKNERKRVGFT